MMASSKRGRSDKKVVVKVADDVKRISTLDILKIAILKRFNRDKTKKSAISQNGIMPDMNRMNDVSTIAIVVDGEVVDIMRAQSRLTSILLANPVFAKIQPDVKVKIGDKFLDGEFVAATPPVQDISPKEFSLGDKVEN
jgi:hypothetical protein